jgi:hypothetical protein
MNIKTLNVGYSTVKIDCSKLSNKGDLVALLGGLFIFSLFGVVIYLAATENAFLAGFMAATITWKWKCWVFDPIDHYLERHWSSSL